MGDAGETDRLRLIHFNLIDLATSSVVPHLLNTEELADGLSHIGLEARSSLELQFFHDVLERARSGIILSLAEFTAQVHSLPGNGRAASPSGRMAPTRARGSSLLSDGPFSNGRTSLLTDPAVTAAATSGVSAKQRSAQLLEFLAELGDTVGKLRSKVSDVTRHELLDEMETLLAGAEDAAEDLGRRLAIAEAAIQKSRELAVEGFDQLRAVIQPVPPGKELSENDSNSRRRVPPKQEPATRRPGTEPELAGAGPSTTSQDSAAREDRPRPAPPTTEKPEPTPSGPGPESAPSEPAKEERHREAFAEQVAAVNCAGRLRRKFRAGLQIRSAKESTTEGTLAARLEVPDISPSSGT